jgi:HTH-type transcriptional regulator / antitoxin HigA
MILDGKRSKTPETARALGDAFDIHPRTFANLQQAYDLATISDAFTNRSE